MGKKSNAKKKQKNLQVEKENKGQATVDFLQKLHGRLTILAQNQRFMASLLGLIILITMIIIGFLIFGKAFGAKPIARFLPADKTVFLLELNNNPQHNQFINAHRLLADDNFFSQENFEKFIMDHFQLDFQKDLKPWFGRSSGLAFINPDFVNDKINTLYFAEIFHEEQFQKFLHQYQQVEQSEFEIFQLGEELFAAQLDDYFFLSQRQKSLEELLEDYSSWQSRLYWSSQYSAVEKHLPVHETAKVFVNFKEVSNSFIQGIPFLSESGVSLDNIEPFTGAFISEGLSFVALDDRFEIKDYLHYLPKNFQQPRKSTSYRAELARLAQENALFFWGAQDLTRQLNLNLQVFANGDQSAVVLFQDIIQNHVSNYFGEGINFFNDLLPFFSNEFALVVEPMDQRLIYKLLLKLPSPATDSEQIVQAVSKFSRIGGLFHPRTIESLLPDGTLSREIIAEPESIERVESEHLGNKIYEMKVANRDWGIFYAIVDDQLILSNYRQGVVNSLEISQGNQSSLKESPIYQERMEPVFHAAQEVIYLDLAQILPRILPPEQIPEWLKSFTALSLGKRFLDDGIKTTNYLFVD